jgi:hypothetical protein
MSDVVKLFSTREAAALMKLSHEGLRLLCRRDQVPCRKVRNKYFMTADDINAAMSPKPTNHQNSNVLISILKD